MIAHAVALALPWIATIFLAVVGVAGAIFPAFLSQAFGIPVASGRAELAYVRATGTRDLVLAIPVAVALVGHVYEMAASFCFFIGALAAFDFLIVLLVRRKNPGVAPLAHIGGCFLFIVCGLLLMFAA